MSPKESQSCVRIVKLPIKKLLVFKKKGQNTTKKSQSCVKIVNLLIKKLLVFFSLDKDYQVHIRRALLILVLRKKILIINIYFHMD